MSNVITLAEAKSAIRLSSTVSDVHIQAILDSQEEWLAGELGVTFTSDTITERVDGGHSLLYLSRLPVTEITSVTDKTNDAVESSDNYMLDNRGIEKETTQAQRFWSSGRKRWEVVYTGGYDGNIPAGLKVPMLQLFARYWNNTPDASSQNSPAAGGISWQGLMDSSLMTMLRPYSLGRFC